MSKMTTDNYRKHTTRSAAQKYLIERFYKRFMQEVRYVKPRRVFDVGCGEGFTLERLYKAKLGDKLSGIDFLKTAIDIGRKERPHLDLREGTIFDIKSKNNSFDLVICSEVLEHIEDPEKGLLELARVSSKYVLLSVPNEPWFRMANFVRGKNVSRWGNDIEHINHWSSNAFEKFVDKHLEVVRVHKPFPWTLLLAKKR